MWTDAKRDPGKSVDTFEVHEELKGQPLELNTGISQPDPPCVNSLCTHLHPRALESSSHGGHLLGECHYHCGVSRQGFSTNHQPISQALPLMV